MVSLWWQNPEFKRRWEEVRSDDPSVRRSALDFWARRLDKLPGPILFAISASEQLLGVWQRVMRVSTPFCACGQRRWLLPHSLVHFYPPENPEPITIGAGVQLALGGWGADTEQTQIQVSVEEGHIVTRLLPYSPYSHAELAQASCTLRLERVEMDRIYLSGTPRPGPDLREPLEKFAKAVTEQQPYVRPIGLATMTTQGTLLWAMYAITRVDMQAGTMEVVVNSSTQIMDRAKRNNPHICYD